MSDVLDKRAYDGVGIVKNDPEEYTDSTWSTLVMGLAQHIIDLKAEVRRLRALTKPELTEEEGRAREYVRGWLASHGDDLASQRFSSCCSLLAAVDRLCPPKKPPSDEELVEALDGVSTSVDSGSRETLAKVINALRARKEQK